MKIISPGSDGWTGEPYSYIVSRVGTTIPDGT